MFSANSSQVSEDRLYVEDVFSTWLYNGVGIGSQTINNGIDLTGKGGMTWVKVRNDALGGVIFDTIRGNNQALLPFATSAQQNLPTWSPSTAETFTFGSNGFSVSKGSNTYAGGYVTGATSNTYASWTFRKAPKFFDVVTYTGNGSTQSISHNLGTAPGTIIVKSYGAGGSWIVYHQSLGAGSRLFLNATNAATTTVPETVWGNNTTTVAPTSTAFTTGSALNASGDTYVAYLFAHDTTSDGIIQCGSFTPNGSGYAEVNLGWEPQWLLIKNAGGTSDWWLHDNMRGFPAAGTLANVLFPNTSGAEQTNYSDVHPTATGFTYSGYTTQQIYIAIRRGPMRTPTSGTSVFAPLAVTPVTGTVRTTGFPVDLSIAKTRTLTYGSLVTDRLRGFVGNTSPNPPTLVTSSTDAETTATYSPASYAFDNTGYKDGPELNGGYPTAYWNFRRAPSFFDEVCYTGTGSSQTLNHNLGVAPELIIVKRRSSTAGWPAAALFTSSGYREGALNGAFALDPADYVSYSFSAQPTATTFSVAGGSATGASGGTYVSYLFASCPGVSKVGSYTGNGSSQTINCGFAAGARFVLIKRIAGGDWYVWDTARGIVAGNDPHLSLNSTAAEVTTDDSVDTDSSGFVVNQLSATNINVSSAQYIYLAVA